MKEAQASKPPVQRLADRLIAARGVLHGELVATTTGKAFKAATRGSRHHQGGRSRRPVEKGESES